jgi:hypothetical protein
MHGRMRSAPAEQLSGNAYWEGDVFKLSVSGEMREAELFGKNLKLTRTIETNYGEKSLILTDKIENENFNPEPMMIMYHFNMGYPLLDEGAKVIMPSKQAVPRDEAAKKNADLWHLAEAPEVNEPERVYLHEMACDSQGNTFTCLVNANLKLGVKISYNKKHLPKFVQWKSLGAGDFAMGLEPTNSGVYGRVGEGENINKIKPFDSETNQFVISIIEGDEEIEKVALEAEKLIEECKC